MMGKNKAPVKVKPTTKERLKQWQRELSVIENENVSLGEIIDRMSRGEDMEFRLKQGAIERRRMRRK